jgi:hypothetical protein
MNDRSRRFRLSVILTSAMKGALDVRMLALFTALVLATTSVAAFPAWRVLASVLDRSPRSGEIARAFDPLAFEDIVMAFVRSAASLSGASLIAALLAVLSWPFVAGVAIARARAGQSQSFAQLLYGGVAYYGRMLRVGLVAIGPYLVTGGIAAIAYRAASRHARHVILESQGVLASRSAIFVTLVVFVGVHASLELGRAAFAADDDLRSGWRAWLRALRLMVRHPARVFGAYLGATLASYVVAALFWVLRIRLSGGAGVALVIGFILAQLGVAALGWGRAARLFALTALSQSHSPVSATPARAPEAVPASARDVPGGSIASRPGSA